ncbi:MAG: hypothetical protein ACOYEW_02565 [Anaerolineae bacterium]
MPVSLSRRRALLALASLPLAACSPRPRAWTPDAPEPPVEDGGRVVLFLVPGLGLSDLLVAARQGDLPHVSRMLERGTLVEALEPAPGVIPTLAEVGRELLQGRTYETVYPQCLTWDLGFEGVVPGPCPAAAFPDEARDAWLEALRQAGEGLLAQGVGDEPAAPGPNGLPLIVLPLDGLLSLQVGHLLAEPRQPGYDPEAAAHFASLWQASLRGLDAALGRVLNRVDLSAWRVALVSTCEAWAVYERLDPGAIPGASAPLAGNAILQAEGEVALPEGEPWSGVQMGRGPGGEVRFLAPAGYVFLPADGALPRAVIRPGGFLLAVGAGMAAGTRMPSMQPASAGAMLSDRRAGDAQVAAS